MTAWLRRQWARQDIRMAALITTMALVGGALGIWFGVRRGYYVDLGLQPTPQFTTRPTREQPAWTGITAPTAPPRTTPGNGSTATPTPTPATPTSTPASRPTGTPRSKVTPTPTPTTPAASPTTTSSSRTPPGSGGPLPTVPPTLPPQPSTAPPEQTPTTEGPP
jgi:hypothetical protein